VCCDERGRLALPSGLIKDSGNSSRKTDAYSITSDAVVMQIRREISEACSKAADERNEPPLDDDA
jgi:hypothetical protein